MGFVTDLTRWFLDDLQREPRGGKWSWVMVSVGTLAVAYGSVGLVWAGVGAHFLLLGVAFAAMGAAEVVPAGRTGLARNLRVGSWVAYVVYAAWIFVPPFLAASLEMQVAVVAGVLFLAGYGWSMYRILRE